MLQYLVSLWQITVGSPFKLVLAVLATLAFAVVAVLRRDSLRLTDGESTLDLVFGLVAGGLFGALSGILWATLNFWQLAPGIHLRLFAFLPPVVGILLGRGAGFICGYVATMVWAQMSGLFIPLHTPIVDAIFVGLTGWIPAWLIRGNKSNRELLKEATGRPWVWFWKNFFVCMFAGLFMATFVAISLEATIDLEFITGFMTIGVASDSFPMMLATGFLSKWLLQGSQQTWSWLRTF